MPQTKDGIFLGGMGSDIYGEPHTAQVARADHVNDYLRDKTLREYIKYQIQNDGLYEGAERDFFRLKMASAAKWFYAGLGGVFALTIINPNFTKRRSWYLRKFSVGFFGLIAYQWGKRQESEKKLMFAMRCHDYFPLEVKRTLESKDFRYMAMFDYRNPSRQLYDPETKKSLS